jgi:DNA replication licensing factor MCM2
MVHFRCLSCDVNLGPFRQNNTTEVRPDLCPCCQRHGPFKVNQEQTVYGNYQKLAIQETPGNCAPEASLLSAPSLGSVPPGRVPRHKDVVLLADLIDVARPGEEVDVTGVYVHSYDAGISGRAGFPIFSTTIEANHVAKRALATEHGCFQMDSEEKRHALRFARDPKAVHRIVRYGKNLPYKDILCCLGHVVGSINSRPQACQMCFGIGLIWWLFKEC